MATQMGEYAVDLLANGFENRVVIRNRGAIQDLDIQKALKMPKILQLSDYDLAWRVSL